MDNINAIWVILILVTPLVGGVVSYVAGHKLSGISLLSVFAIVLAIGTYTFFVASQPLEINTAWISFKGHSFDIGLRYDTLSGIMVLVVAIVALLVAVFSLEYMKDDASKARYFSLLGLFAFAMYGIILSSNLLLTFVFWELVGFSSYLLIGFWYNQEKPPLSSFKAFIMNKIGDAGFLLSIFILFAYYKTLNIQQLLASDLLHSIPPEMLFLAGLGLFIAAMGKSAQFPLYSWLPDAMTGPTPTSALIHAATMVAAGVYLLVRVFPLIPQELLTIIGVFGGITAFVGAFSAFAQNDIKKILAYSTVSQLGYMMMAIGAGFPTIALFHLITHAFFKAGLFLSAGSIIHYYHKTNEDHNLDIQDILNMGGLRKILPFTFIVFTICTLSLVGIPFFSGFLSKELILNGLITSDLPTFVVVFGFGSVFMTAAYMARLYFRVFFGQTSGGSRYHEAINIKIPLMVLSALSLWFFYAINPFDPEHNSISYFLKDLVVDPEAGHNTYVLLSSVILSSMGVYFSYMYVERNSFLHVVSFFKKMYLLSQNGLYLDLFYRKFVAHGTMQLGQLLLFFDQNIVDGLINSLAKIKIGLSRVVAWFDQFIIDGFVNLIVKIEVVLAYLIGWSDKYIVDGVVNLIAWKAKFVGNRTRSIQNGNVQMYFVWALFGFLVIIYFLNF